MKILNMNLSKKVFTLLVLVMTSMGAFSQTTVVLSTHQPTAPFGSTFQWYSATPVSNMANKLSSALIAAAPAGTYYGAFTDNAVTSPCYSPEVKVDVVTNICPATTANITSKLPTGATMEWHLSPSPPTSGNLISNTAALTVGAGTYIAYNNVAGVYTYANEVVIVTIIPTLAAPIATSGVNQIACETSPIQTLTASATGNTVTWYDAATGGSLVSPTLNTVGTKNVFAQNSDSSYCPSTTRTAFVLTINPAPAAPTLPVDVTVCATGSQQTLTATATVPSGSSIVWYDAASGGNIVSPATLVSTIATTKILYGQTSNGTCSSLTRTAVTLKINPAPAAPTLPVDVTVCATGSQQTLTATATVPSGSSIVWYDAASGGNIVSPATLVSTIAATKILYGQTSNGTCSSLTRTAVTLKINPAPVAPNLTATAIQNPCPVITANLLAIHTETTPPNTTLVWYTTITATTGTVYNTPETAATGATYYAFYLDTVHGCLSQASAAVTVSTSICCPAGYNAPIIH